MTQVGGAVVIGLVVLGACSGGSDGVTVRTVSEYEGTPIAGVNVQVDDQAWAVTDEAGEVVFEPAGDSFTVRVHQLTIASNGNQHEDVWVLPDTRGGEVVVEVDGSYVPRREASIGGTLTGRADQASSQVLLYASTGGTDPILGEPAPADAFEMSTVQWESAVSKTITLHALQADVAYPPTHYSAYGSVEVEATDPGGGGSVTGVSLAMEPVGEEHVTGDLVIPAALSTGLVTGLISIEPAGGSMLIAGVTQATPDPPATFDYVVPDVPGAAAWIRFYASAPAPGDYSTHSQRVELPSTGVTLDLPAPATLIEPAEGAALEPSTSFSWTAGPAGGIHDLGIVCEWSEGEQVHSLNYRGIRTGSATTGSLPDIPDVTIAPGAACSWNVVWIEETPDSWRMSASASRSLTVP